MSRAAKAKRAGYHRYRLTAPVPDLCADAGDVLMWAEDRRYVLYWMEGRFGEQHEVVLKLTTSLPRLRRILTRHADRFEPIDPDTPPVESLVSCGLQLVR